MIAGKSVLELTSLASFFKNRFSLGLEPKCRLFWRHFPKFKKRKKSRIQPNSKIFSKKYSTKHAYLFTTKNILGVRCTLSMAVQFMNESEISDVASKATSAPSKVVMRQLKRNRSTAKGILTKKRNEIELLINKFESSAAVELKLSE